MCINNKTFSGFFLVLSNDWKISDYNITEYFKLKIRFLNDIYFFSQVLLELFIILYTRCGQNNGDALYEYMNNLVFSLFSLPSVSRVIECLLSFVKPFLNSFYFYSYRSKNTLNYIFHFKAETFFSVSFTKRKKN